MSKKKKNPFSFKSTVDDDDIIDAEDLKEKSKKPARIVLGVIIAIFIFSVISGSFYHVSEQENAVVTQFGKVIRTDTAGLYFKIPFIQKVKMVDITTHGTGIGYSIDGEGQNITNTDDGIMITSDFNLLNIDFYLEYKVSDPVAYLYNSDHPEEILKDIALASIRSVVSNYTVDEAMTTMKGQIQSEVKSEMVEALNLHNIGLQVINITVQDSEPPTADIIAEFKAVETAKQGADTAMNNALQYQNQQIPKANADADKILQDAEATKQARIAEAEGQVARLNAIYEQYKLYPLITKTRMFYEAIEEVLPNAKIIITDGSTETIYPLEDFASITNETTTIAPDSSQSTNSTDTTEEEE